MTMTESIDRVVIYLRQGQGREWRPRYIEISIHFLWVIDNLTASWSVGSEVTIVCVPRNNISTHPAVFPVPNRNKSPDIHWTVSRWHLDNNDDADWYCPFLCGQWERSATEKMPKKPSRFWMFFQKIDRNTAECRLCGKHLRTCGNTTNLGKHIRRHPNYRELAGDSDDDKPIKREKLWASGSSPGGDATDGFADIVSKWMAELKWHRIYLIPIHIR